MQWILVIKELHSTFKSPVISVGQTIFIFPEGLPSWPFHQSCPPKPQHEVQTGGMERQGKGLQNPNSWRARGNL